jgi:phage antirepressor YoqD-like protein
MDELLADPDMLIAALTELKAEREQNKVLQQTVAVQKQQIEEFQPKASYYDVVLNSKSLVTITQIAKDYGMSGKAMNKLLADLKVQYKQSRQWLLYSKYQSCGYTHSQTFDIEQADGQTRVVMETKWTQKGRLFLYQLLRLNDILPLIERD